MDTRSKFVSPPYVSEVLGLSLTTVRRRLADKSIPSTRLGGRILVARSYLDDLELRASVAQEA